MSSVIDLRKIKKTYYMGDQSQEVLRGLDFKVEPGEMVSVMGESGSGKSTMMNIVGLLDRPSEGEYFLKGREVSTLTDDEQAEMRNLTIGFVFQSFFLLPRLTALQNITLPLLYRGLKGSESRKKCMEMLDRVGIAQLHDHRPSQMSGGQQQRVAVARALIGSPHLLLADEPTGALDSNTSEEVMALFKDLHKTDKTTILIITHDPHVAEQCERQVRIKDGEMSEDN